MGLNTQEGRSEPCCADQYVPVKFVYAGTPSAKTCSGPKSMVKALHYCSVRSGNEYSVAHLKNILTANEHGAALERLLISGSAETSIPMFSSAAVALKSAGSKVSLLIWAVTPAARAATGAKRENLMIGTFQESKAGGVEPGTGIMTVDQRPFWRGGRRCGIERLLYSLAP